MKVKTTALKLLYLLLLITPLLFASGMKKFVFEERTIEGKIRRPQLVMIRAEQRPEFSLMIMKGPDKGINLDLFTTGDIVEGSPYKKPFEVKDKKITNYHQ